MSKRLGSLALLLAALPLTTAAQNAAQDSAQNVVRVPFREVPAFLGWVPDELVVELTPEARRDLVVRRDATGALRVNRPMLQAVIDGLGVQDMRRQFVNARPQPEGSALPDLTGYYKVQLPAGLDLEVAFAGLDAAPDVDHVERIGIHSLSAEPNDPYFRDSPNPSYPYDQWHLYGTNSIHADQAWDSQAGSADVLVGILDSGTRYFHFDLGGNSPQWGPDAPFAGGNVFVNPGETPGNGVDDDGNGFTDDTIGWDFVSSAGGGGVTCIDTDCSGVDNDPDDTNGHGTHTAGTVGAITNNNALVAGVAGGFSDGTTSGTGNGARILPLRIGYHARYFGITTGIVRMDWAAEAMVYTADLVDAGHNVASINCSWGSSDSGGLNAAVDTLQSRDVLIVKAAGNSNSSSADYLGTKAGVMNVAATDSGGAGASFTNYGSWVDVAAPGVEILSLYRNPDDPDPTAHYISVLDGTSMAAPHVAGIAALLESCVPSLTRQQKFDLIVGNTDPYSDARDLGAGIANAKKALDAAGCTGGGGCDVVADFVGTPQTGCGTLSVAFTDLSSGSGIDTWAWDFGDGNVSGAQNPTHLYGAPGTYTVSLTASGGGCSDAETKVAYVTVGAVPIADFSGTPTSGSAPLTVSFSDLSSESPTSWSWDFGDGNGSSAENPSHTYTAPGTYTVTLTATNACGSDGATKVDYITVTEASDPTAMGVGGILVTKEGLSKGNKQGVATATILDDQGNPVAGATVTGDFSGKTTDIGVSGVTDANGQVVLTSSSAKGGGEWCFEVTNVTHATLAYDPGLNFVTQSCESGDVF
jgi:PKD repeat protein